MSSLDKKIKNEQKATSSTALTAASQQQMDQGKASIRGVIDNFNAKPYVPFSGPQVADLTGDEQTARDMTRDLAPRDAVQYRTFADFDPEMYYNKFEDEVVAANGAFMDEDLAAKRSAIQAGATQAGAYGGSRHGVADAELNRTALMDKAKMQADLRYQGYEGAKQQFNTDSQGLYSAGVRNSDAKFNDTMTTIDTLSKMGASEREIEQAKMLADKAQYDEAYADEWKRFQLKLQTEMGLFGSTPLLTTNTSSGSSTSKTSDPIGTISSLAGGIGGLFGGINAGT